MFWWHAVPKDAEPQGQGLVLLCVLFLCSCMPARCAWPNMHIAWCCLTLLVVFVVFCLPVLRYAVCTCWMSASCLLAGTLQQQSVQRCLQAAASWIPVLGSPMCVLHAVHAAGVEMLVGRWLALEAQGPSVPALLLPGLGGGIGVCVIDSLGLTGLHERVLFGILGLGGYNVAARCLFF
jgi:hypothetical protein